MKKWVAGLMATGLLLQTGAIPNVKANTEVEEKVEVIEDDERDQVEEVGVPEIAGRYGVAIDAYTGEVLYEKNAYEKAYPASITKVLTAILVAEHLDMDETITFSSEAVHQEGSNSQILFKEGEQTTVKNALEAMMIVSANDAAYALAEAVAGSVEEFADMMNAKAEELGARDTYFVTPNGLNNAEHKTTAYDMALFGREALNYPIVIEKMAQREATIVTNEREVPITSPNSIPKSNPLAIGGKTGYTSDAQHTLLEILEEKDGRKVVTVTMYSTRQGKYDDMNIMGEYALPKASASQKLYEGEEIYRIVEIGGEELPLVIKEDVYIPSNLSSDDITEGIVWNRNKQEYAPGETIGWLVIEQGDNMRIGKFALVTNVEFKPNQKSVSLKRTSGEGRALKSGLAMPEESNVPYYVTIGAIIVIPVLVFFVLLMMTNLKAKKKRLNNMKR